MKRANRYRSACLVVAWLGSSCNGLDGPSPAPEPAALSLARPDPSAKECVTDADCRAFADTCTGCDCRALSVCQPDPVCKGPGVQCLIDPCARQESFCEGGRCALRPQTRLCPITRCGPRPRIKNTLCPDGKTVAGPTDRCLLRAWGACTWEVTTCPDPGICPSSTPPAAGVGEVCRSRDGDPVATCAEGLACCYPCGFPGCASVCTVPCKPGDPACENGCFLLP